MSDLLEVFDGGVGWEKSVPHEEDVVHEGPYLDCSVVAGELGAFARSEVEVESQDDQISDLTDFGVV